MSANSTSFSYRMNDTVWKGSKICLKSWIVSVQQIQFLKNISRFQTLEISSCALQNIFEAKINLLITWHITLSQIWVTMWYDPIIRDVSAQIKVQTRSYAADGGSSHRASIDYGHTTNTKSGFRHQHFIIPH